MAKSVAGARLTGWIPAVLIDAVVGTGIGVSCSWLGVGPGEINVAVEMGVGIVGMGCISSKVRYMTNSRRFASAGGSLKVRTSWLPSRTTGRV